MEDTHTSAVFVEHFRNPFFSSLSLSSTQKDKLGGGWPAGIARNTSGIKLFQISHPFFSSSRDSVVVFLPQRLHDFTILTTLDYERPVFEANSFDVTCTHDREGSWQKETGLFLSRASYTKSLVLHLFGVISFSSCSGAFAEVVLRPSKERGPQIAAGWIGLLASKGEREGPGLNRSLGFQSRTTQTLTKACVALGWRHWSVCCTCTWERGAIGAGR